MRFALSALFISLAGPTLAGEFLFPVDCTLGQDCFIQHYVDRDPGPDVRDFGCGTLSYDGHKGTDIALPDLAAMQGAGIAVRSTLAGRVRGLRDGVPDRGPGGVQEAMAAGMECGNGVVLDHGNGLESQYCHLRQGSLQVQEGQELPAGSVLGLVGQSGAADFPHLHFELRRNGETLDPFQPDAVMCQSLAAALWRDDVAYVPTGLTTVGFSTEIPDYDALMQGDAPDLPQAASPAFVLWTVGFGSLPGDQLRLTLVGPDGIVLDKRIMLDRAQARYMRAVGLRLQAERWTAGVWRGDVVLIRDGQQIARRTISRVLD